MTFFNIFSKTEKESKREKIIIDNREKNSLVPSYLAELGFQIEFEQLPVADYLVKETAIERKTISDLKSSIINKRIFSQLKDLKQYNKYFLIIEGVKNNIYEGLIHENALRGFLISLAEQNIPFIFSQDEKDTAKYLSLIANKKQKSVPSIRATKSKLSDLERAQFILEGFQNIGPTTAKLLLSHFKSLKNIFNASEEELEKLIGKKSLSLLLLNKEFKSLSEK